MNFHKKCCHKMDCNDERKFDRDLFANVGVAESHLVGLICQRSNQKTAGDRIFGRLVVETFPTCVKNRKRKKNQVLQNKKWSGWMPEPVLNGSDL